MGELSILTIVVSLAVCSILAVALYQYVNQRLSLAEHSQKEQAMILHQYIEESSYDIHCLKQQLSHAHKMGVGVSQSQPQEVYYQQYYQDNENNATEVNEVQHKCVHIDTVMYDSVMINNTGKQSSSPRMNLNHRLIPVSSDSENTTTDDDDDNDNDTDSESDSDSDSDSGSENSSESYSGTACDNDTIKIIELSQEVTISKKNDTALQESDSDSDDESTDSDDESTDSDGESTDSDNDTETGTESIVNIVDVVQCNPELTIESDIPLTLDSTSFDLAIESIAVEQLSDIVDLISITEVAPETVAPEVVPESTSTDTPASSDVTSNKPPIAHAAAATQSQFVGMSVGDLRQFIKDKCKQNPEKTAEIGDIQKMKKAALVQLAEQLH
jgi:hypothetical protein